MNLRCNSKLLFVVGSFAALILSSFAGAISQGTSHYPRGRNDEGRLGDAFASTPPDHNGDMEGDQSAQFRRRAKKGHNAFSSPGKSKKSSVDSAGPDFETIQGRLEIMTNILGFDDRVAALEFALEPTDFPCDPDALPALQDFLQAEGMCFTGTADSVTNACGPECCVGEDACVWNDEATVCVGSCKGYRACKEIRSSSTILPFSCVGDYVCDSLGGIDGDGPASFLRVGPISCRDFESCRNVGSDDNAGNNQIIIQPKSCVGGESCYDFGKKAKGDVLVGHKSCLGRVACETMGRDAEDFAIIGDNSCVGEEACQRTFYFVEDNVTVGSNACVGDYACYALGNYAGGVGVVGDTSCVGDHACSRLGSNNFLGSYRTEIVIVGNNSCVGNYTCFYLGGEEVEEFVIVGHNSCIGDEACFDLGKYADDNVAVGSDSCVGGQSCYRVGRGESDGDVGIVSVGDDACIGGDQICFEFGQSVTSDSDVLIATGACADADDVCGTEAVGGDNCDAAICNGGQSFSMPANEQACNTLCSGP